MANYHFNVLRQNLINENKTVYEVECSITHPRFGTLLNERLIIEKVDGMILHDRRVVTRLIRDSYIRGEFVGKLKLFMKNL